MNVSIFCETDFFILFLIKGKNKSRCLFQCYVVFCLVSVSVLCGDLPCVCFSIVRYFPMCFVRYCVVFCLVFFSVLCGVLLCVWFGIVWCFALCLVRYCVVICFVFVSVLWDILPCICLMMMMSWCLMSSDVIWHIRDKLWPMPKHGSIILYVHGNQKAR